jgi:Chaperone of endosialidase
MGVALLPKTQAVVPPPDGGYPGSNTAEGQNALFSLTTGVWNTAIGFNSLYANETGSANTAVGFKALAGSFESARNTAIGALALTSSFRGTENTAVGYGTLYFNGSDPSMAGSQNSAFGSYALVSNTVGHYNSAFGWAALASNTDGVGNSAFGYGALSNNTIGSGNTALGTNAGSNITVANNVICIGTGVAGADVSNTTWVGNIYGVTTQSGTTAQVIVSDTGQLGTVASSERFKKDIGTMEKASGAILSLRPVTFHYKSDAKQTPQYGLIAEEVAKVNPTLVLPDQDGKPYTVRYDAVNAMLLNEFLKEHRRVEQLKSEMAQQRKYFETAIAQQRRATEALVARLNEQEAQIQKVSAQIETSSSATPILVENH